jgi:hypothetical protein
MSEILEKFVKNLGKLDEYYVLRQEKEQVIIGTKINFLEYKPEIMQVFSTYEPDPIIKELPVFFLVTASLKTSPLDKSFLQNNLPLLSINKHKGKLTVEGIKNLLEDFIMNNFKY